MEAVVDRDDKPELDRQLDTARCPDCGAFGFKPFYGSVRFGAVMQSHFNVTTNTMISDPRQFDRELKRKAQVQHESTGIPHSYEQVDLHDREALGVTDEGLQATHDRAVAEGRKEPTRTRVWAARDFTPPSSLPAPSSTPAG